MLSKPTVFILNNRWDASASEPDMMEMVCCHLPCDWLCVSVTFLVIGCVSVIFVISCVCGSAL